MSIVPESKLAGSRVLVTGGTGSFGQTMVSFLAEKGAEEIRVVSRDEAKQDALRSKLGGERVRWFLGDVRDPDSLVSSMRGVDYIFHAAALKQVPSGEFFPQEVVKTNVLGSWNVMRQAARFDVKAMVCLSTDKAVYPINAMGMSKALMEKNAFAMAREIGNSSTRFVVTRYGNVLMSRGSVIPRFINQVLNGQRLTITNPEMTRFLMSLKESVALVEHAFEFGQTGDLYVQKAPAASIGDLANAVSNLLGKATGYERIGTRHGEKLYESLLSSEERAKAEDDERFFRVPLDDRDLNYEKFFDSGEEVPSESEPYTSHNTEQLSIEPLKKLLLANDEFKIAIDA